jgi:hypothetical protein
MLHFTRKSVHLTKTDKLLRALEDGRFHSTDELVRRVGHTFVQVKYRLVKLGYPIERQPHPSKPHHFQYRLRERLDD